MFSLSVSHSSSPQLLSSCSMSTHICVFWQLEDKNLIYFCSSVFVPASPLLISVF